MKMNLIAEVEQILGEEKYAEFIVRFGRVRQNAVMYWNLRAIYERKPMKVMFD